MIVGAFLAEAASVVDNKLNVSGGVLYRFAVDPDRSAQFLLVVLTQAETDDPDRRVDVEVWPPTATTRTTSSSSYPRPPSPPRSDSPSSGSR